MLNFFLQPLLCVLNSLQDETITKIAKIVFIIDKLPTMATK